MIDAGVLAAAQSLPPKAKNVRVYFEVSRGPMPRARRHSFIRRIAHPAGRAQRGASIAGPVPRLNPGLWCANPTSS